jgi:hypothetical protein
MKVIISYSSALNLWKNGLSVYYWESGRYKEVILKNGDVFIKKVELYANIKDCFSKKKVLI